VPRYFALVPAAGSGSRVGGAGPKQYAPLAGHPLLYYTLRRLVRNPAISQVFVVLAPGDERFRTFNWEGLETSVFPLYCGGETRAASVFNGLVAVHDAVGADDWVLVHDAARPCLTDATLQRLIDEIGTDDSGGLLAVPVADTLKRASSDKRIVETASREQLWQAQTPQMFRYAVLVEALRRAPRAEVTDEASAVERLGIKPKLVMGEARNLKVTYTEDLELASLILEHETKVESEAALMITPRVL
jgi:2-C-methyl-D-erythritol 4-phosphate cytidylyltransferase